MRLLAIGSIALVLALVAWRVPAHGLTIVNATSRPLVIEQVWLGRATDGPREAKRLDASLLPGERISVRLRKPDIAEATHGVVARDASGAHSLGECGYIESRPSQYVAEIHEGPALVCRQGF